MPPTEKFTTRLTPFDVKEFYTGTNARTQKEFTIYQVRARGTNGQEITAFPLRSFDNLKLHEEIEVECQLFDGGQQYGYSYTIKPVKKSGSGASAARIEKLEREVAFLYQHLKIQPPGAVAAPATPPSPPAAAVGPPTGPPPPAPTPVSAPPVSAPQHPTQVPTSTPPAGPGSQYGEDPPF